MNMEQSCMQCSAAFEITHDDLAFYEKVSPIFNGKKELIPPPTLCPQCRQQRRLCFRNQIYVYSRTSSKTGKNIFSMYTQDAPVYVMENKIWYGDEWDAMDYGRSFDFTRPFFDQFKELFQSVPLPTRAFIPEMINSDYSNNATALKNCYLVFNASYAEDSMYCESIWQGKDCIDCTRVPQAELCYDCCACGGSYNIQNSQGALNCSDSFFLWDCLSCKNCFGCVNLCRRDYCIFNEQKTKEEYRTFLKSVDLQSYKERQVMKTRFMDVVLTLPQPELKVFQSEDASGNYISNCKSVHDSFFMRNAENVKFGFGMDDGTKDCMDITLWGDGIQLAYESTLVGGQSMNLLFCCLMFQGNANLAYCTAMTNSSDCFGCSGLKHKRHCIFNVQYTEEEYHRTVARIIAHMRERNEWGEHFPMIMSPIPYNQSLAGRYCPLSREEIAAKDLRWHEEHREEEQGISADALPDRLPPTDDPIIVQSVISGRPFKITSQEIKRYRQFNVPLPRMTYDERMERRALSMGEIKLYDRTSVKTGMPIRTTFPPDSPYIVWTRDEWEKEYWS